MFLSFSKLIDWSERPGAVRQCCGPFYGGSFQNPNEFRYREAKECGTSAPTPFLSGFREYARHFSREQSPVPGWIEPEQSVTDSVHIHSGVHRFQASRRSSRQLFNAFEIEFELFAA